MPKNLDMITLLGRQNSFIKLRKKVIVLNEVVFNYFT